MLARFDQRPTYFDRILDDGREFRMLLAEIEFAGVDARNVKEIIHEPCELARLTADNITAPNQRRVVLLGPPEDFDSVSNRGKRIAQLVAQRRKEDLFAAIGFSQVLNEKGVVDRNSALRREIDRECNVARFKPWTR